MPSEFDAIVVGTGFASSFFLHALLRHRPGLRVLVLETGELERMVLRCIFEDLPRTESRVRVSDQDPTMPELHFAGRSRYLDRGVSALGSDLERVLAPLPVERIEISERLNQTESHILGTARMGDDPASSIVDRNLVHHEIRNLLVLGGSAFPVGSPSNPTLTIAALSLWAAARLVG